MNKAMFIDRGAEEVLIINNKEIRVDYLSTKQLIGLLQRYELLDIEMIGYDVAMSNK